MRGAGSLRRIRQRGRKLFLRRQRSPAHQRDGRFPRRALFLQACANHAQIAHAHVEAQRGTARCQASKCHPVNGRGILRRVLVAGDERNARTRCRDASPECPRTPVPQCRPSRRAPPGTGYPHPPDASASSPPRPNTNGSPPFSRTSVPPPRCSSWRALSTSRALMSSCVVWAAKPFFPTYRRSADAGTRSSSAVFDR